MRSTTLIALIVAAVALGNGCNRKKENPPPPPVPSTQTQAPSHTGVTVTTVTMGRAVGSDKKITAPSETFLPKDTIYASVDTQGAAPSAQLSAKWTFEDGQTVHEETQPIAPSGPATTEFHIAKPDGWPAGNYRLEIMLDGVTAKTVSFRVS